MGHSALSVVLPLHRLRGHLMFAPMVERRRLEAWDVPFDGSHASTHGVDETNADGERRSILGPWHRGASIPRSSKQYRVGPWMRRAQRTLGDGDGSMACSRHDSERRRMEGCDSAGRA